MNFGFVTENEGNSNGFLKKISLFQGFEVFFLISMCQTPGYMIIVESSFLFTIVSNYVRIFY